ncbi:glucosyltransferase domain-containing protein [Rouxiella sp. T17]|uniref:glucosyltransferase domain-containing protein n=1 Tax=Rouxiella sp. T17 TaxID=3085684 RepID=UPI002FC7B21B
MRDTSGLIALSNRQIIIAVTFLFGLVATLPLWTYKVYYRDDYLRLVTGDNFSWLTNGRPLTVLINMVLRFNYYSNDITPLPLILGLMVLSIAAVIYVEKLQLGLKGFWQCISPLLLILNPFLTQPFQYSFDSLTISLAIALGLLASFTYQVRLLVNLLITCLILLMMLSIYQIGTNIFISAVILLSLAKWHRQESIKYYLLEKALACITSLLIYKLLVANFLIGGSYTMSHSESLPIGRATPQIVWTNLQDFYSMFMLAFPGLKVLFLIIPLAMAFGGLAVLFIKNQVINKAMLGNYPVSKVLTTGGVLMLLPLMLIVSIAGVSLLLLNPAFQIRVLPAYSGLALFCFYVSIQAFPKFKYWIAGLQLIVLFYNLVLMVSCFNALVNQQSHIQETLERIKIEISHLPINEVTNIAFIGQLRPSPDIITTLNNFPIAAKITNDWGIIDMVLRANLSLKLTPVTEAMAMYIPDHYISQDCEYSFFLYQGVAVIDYRTNTRQKAEFNSRGCQYAP